MTPWRPLLPSLGSDSVRALRRVGALLLAVVLAIPVVQTQAHVDVDVGDGQYVMEIGFRDEPAYLGQLNAVYVHVEEYGSGGTEPVDGLAATLAVEVTKDGQSLNPALIPTGDGSYEAPFVPTTTGDYTFRVTGTIGDSEVDESITSGPSTFNSVEPMTGIEFPVAQPDAAALASMAEASQAEAAQARTLGLAGIAVGILGLIVGGLALARAGRGGNASRLAEVSDAAPASESPGKLIR